MTSAVPCCQGRRRSDDRSGFSWKSPKPRFQPASPYPCCGDMSTSVASRYSQDSAPCGTVDSRKWRPVKRLPTSRPSLSASGSTTVSTVRSATARSRASTVSDAPASSPFGVAADSLRAWTSVMPHLQYQLASHPTPLQALMRRGRAFERKSFRDRHLEVAGLKKVGGQLEHVAVGLDQRLKHTQAALF